MNMFTKPARKRNRITSDERPISVVSEIIPCIDEQTAKDSTPKFFTDGNPAAPDISKAELGEIELPEHAPEAENANIEDLFENPEESSGNPEAFEVLVNESNIITHETLDNLTEISTAEGVEVFPLESPNNGETFEGRVRDLIQHSSSQSI
ncbi:hypothetical protein RUND412_004290 [Rhizina undulata]